MIFILYDEALMKQSKYGDDAYRTPIPNDEEAEIWQKNNKMITVVREDYFDKNYITCNNESTEEDGVIKQMKWQQYCWQETNEL